MDVAKIRIFENTLYDKIETSYASLAKDIRDQKKLTDEIEEKIKELIDHTVQEVSA